MAYGDYGAFVYKNGVRREDKEDAPTFASNEETFGQYINNIPSGARIWLSLLHASESGKIIPIHHGIMGDGDIRVACHKQGLPQIVEATEDGFKEIKYCSDDIDPFEYDIITYDYKGYKFVFEEGKPYYASMTEPNGDEWVCEYDYEYGAGF